MHLPTDMDDDRKALARIVVGLFALLGLTAGQFTNVAPQRIARSLHRAVSLVLRPAESAVRRLIFFISLTTRAKPAPARSMPANLVRTGAGKARPAFRLFDPRPRLVLLAKSRAKAARPQIRISFFGDGEVRTLDLRDAPKDTQSDGLIESAKILRRLEALKIALDNLPRQARRLRRALQRRSAAPRLKWQGPLRRGHPPGHRKRRLHEIDDVLQRCHWRAREALPPDTS